MKTPTPRSSPGRRMPAAGGTAVAAAAPGAVRIIGGQWRRSLLPVAARPGLRPTPDRVRETLFNWLGQDLTGWHCLDAFAGSGALGFEAASRGAAAVHLVEQDAVVCRQLRDNQARLQGADMLRIQRGDGLAVLRAQGAASLDLVFLDPPFDSARYPEALGAAAHAVKPAGYVYLEAGEPWADDRLQPLGLQVWRVLKAGAVHAHLLRRIA